MHCQSNQRGFILLPVVLAIVLIAAIAFLVNTESAINVDMTANTTAAAEAEQVARAGLAHATWGAQNSGCAGDMVMTTVPFGQAGNGSYTATVTTPGGTTSAYPNIAVVQDAWFRSDNITDNNGTANTLHLRRESGDLEYTIVRFDLSSIPSGAQINSALARFYVDGGKGHPEGPVTVHRVTADWTEAGATWQTHDDRFEHVVLDTIPPQPDDGDVWVEVNLTAQVQAWVNGAQANFGIMLIPTGENTHAEYVSREGAASQQPRLDVIVGNGPASPMKVAATGTLTGNPSLANDITRTLTRTNVPTYQPPGAVTLQLGTDPGEDTILDSFYGLRNYGGANYLQVHDNGWDWQQYPLIRFDLARLPRGAAVRSAQLELRLWSVNTPGTATIHPVTRSWVEGTKSGGGTADGATWHTYDGTNPWTSAGGDINAPVVAETAINGGETWVSWEIAPLVERWLAGEPNYGLLIKPDNVLDAAKFYSKENTTVGVKPKLTITYACECGSLCLTPQGTGTVGMVVIDPTNLVPTDAYRKALFESWGYTVNVIGENANAVAYATAAASNDVFYISETVNSSQVGPRIKAVPIGVVSEDGDYNDDLGFATGSGHTAGAALNVTDSSHYITAPFPTGPLDIYAVAMEQLTVSGTAAPGLQQLADTGGAGSLVVLDKGADMAGGGTTAGRRVMLPLGRVGNFNWDYLNGNGRLIVQRAVQWGTGNTDGPPNNLLLVVVDPASLTAQEAAKQALIESWGYTVNLIDESDSQASFDAAIAANDVAYIPQDINSTNLGIKLASATIGVVNEEGEQVDELGISGDKVFKTRHEIDVVDNTHYITQPFATGLLTFVSSDQSVHMLSGSVAPGLQTLGESFNIGNQWEPSLGTLDVVDPLSGGGTAAGRRVQLPWGGGTFDINQLNDDGRTIMQRAIEWAEDAGAAPSADKLLLVVMDPATLTPQEDAKKTLFESWGYTVSLIDAADSQAAFDAAVAVNDVVYITEDVTASTVGTKLVGAPIGVVTEEDNLSDEFGFSADIAWASDVEIQVNNNTHYITQPFAIGNLTILTATESLAHLTGAVAPGLQVLGRIPEGISVVSVAAGADVIGGGTAAGRRVLLPWGGDNFDINHLNDDGKTLLQRALEWAAGAGLGSVPIAHWKFDEGSGATAYDSVGGNDASLSGDPAWTAGTLGGALDFDASGDYVRTDSSFSPPAVGTVAFWMQVPGSPASRGRILGLSDSWEIRHESTAAPDVIPYSLAFDLGIVGSNLAFHTTTTIDSPGHWYHIAAAYDTNTDAYAVYVDGVLDKSGTYPSALSVPAADQLSIGTRTGSSDYFDGLLDDVRIYDHFLSAAEIAALAAAGGGGGGGSPPVGLVLESFSEQQDDINSLAITIDKPAGTVAGDLLIAAVATDDNNADSLAPPTGWNLVHVANSGRVTFGVWWKVAGTSEGISYTFNWSQKNKRAYGWIMRFSGHEPVTPVNATAYTSGSSAAPPSPSVTTTTDNTLILRLGGFRKDEITVGDPGLSGHTAINMNYSHNGANAVSGGSGYVLQPAAGISGSSSFALTGNNDYVTVTLAIDSVP